jgi:hypothetical protein
MEDYMMRANVERNEKWRERVKDIPFLRFDPSWEIAVIPPFAGAVSRFLVRKGKAEVSVYLDFDCKLGYMDGPYWEIHPLDGDCGRFMLNETDELLAGIAQSIAEQSTPTPEGGG